MHQLNPHSYGLFLPEQFFLDPFRQYLVLHRPPLLADFPNPHTRATSDYLRGVYGKLVSLKGLSAPPASPPAGLFFPVQAVATDLKVFVALRRKVSFGQADILWPSG